MADVMQGNLVEGGSKILSGIGEGASAVASTVKEGISSVASALNPFNWFQEGTREIQKTGLGVLHQGEVVMPAGIVEQIAAKGAGAFKEEGFFGSLFSGVRSALGTAGDVLLGKTSPTEGLTNVLSKGGSFLSTLASPITNAIGASPFGGLLSTGADLLSKTGLGGMVSAVSSLFGAGNTPADLQDRLQQEQVSVAADAVSVASDAIDVIAENTENLEYLYPILETLKRIESALTEVSATEVSNVPETPNTRGHRRAPSPPNFHELPIGIMGQSPTRQVTNIGLH
jgi:hypothetical protein